MAASILRFARVVSTPALAALLLAACGSDEVSSDDGSDDGSGASAQGGGSSSGGAPAQGGSGNVTTTGSGGMVTAECESDADCTTAPETKCNVGTGLCVECLPGTDECPDQQYCDGDTFTCQIGCTGPEDCPPDLTCNTQDHDCVGCVTDTDCGPGTICIADSCVPGCSASQPCAGAETCCGSTCIDGSSDIANCGMCNNVCPVPANAAAACTGGICEMGGCTSPFANCNGQSSDGCEQNTLQDGACLCSPGTTQPCYLGAPGTQNVGPCHGGTQTCNADGLSWGACLGQVLPGPELCADGVDQNCDGAVDNGADEDGDGWTICNGDCCDSILDGCTSPKLVNPGAFEFINNSANDDCDSTTSDTVAAAACSSAAKFTNVTGTDVAKAMDLCQFTTANPPLPQKKWGVITAQQLLANGNAPSATQLNNMQDYQDAVLVNYGTGGIVPKKGPTMAGISSGRMRDQNDTGYVNPNSGTSFASSSQPPAAYLAAHGGSLPSSQGCSGNCPAGSGANDSTNVKLTIRVPTNAQSFSYSFRFFSAEYWTYQCTSFNDFYLALLQTGAPGIPADKNISFDGAGNPVSVNNGFFDLCVVKGCNTCPSGTGELAGTGMQLNSTGGGTKWLTTDAPVVPGETMVLELMVFDVSDGILDSLTLLDNWVWNAAPAQVSTHE